MKGDKLDAILDLARDQGFSDTDIRIRASFREARCDTLRQVLDRITALNGETPIGIKYPQGLRLVLDGQHGELNEPTPPDLRARPSADESRSDPGVDDGQEGIPRTAAASDDAFAFAGFGDRPYTAFTAAAVTPTVELVRRASAARSRQRSALAKQIPERSLGQGAAEQYVTVVHIIGAALVEHGLTSHNPVTAVHAPPRPTPRQSKHYSVDQVFDYVSAILLNSADPKADMLMWAFLRTSGCRRGGMLHLEVPDIDPTSGRVVLYRKGRTDSYITAVHIPLLRACLALEEQRRQRGALPGPVFLTTKGTPYGRHHIQDWSAELSEQFGWARSRRNGVRPLRHNAAQAVHSAVGDPFAASLLLGHATPKSYGATSTYLVDRFADPFPAELRAVQATLGPITGWPTLPEIDLVLGALPANWRTL